MIFYAAVSYSGPGPEEALKQMNNEFTQVYSIYPEFTIRYSNVAGALQPDNTQWVIFYVLFSVNVEGDQMIKLLEQLEKTMSRIPNN